MKCNLIGLLLFCASFVGISQPEERVKVPGSKCSLVPPTGFKVTPGISGFSNQETGASIVLYELPVAYKKMVDEFTADALKGKGMQLMDRQVIPRNDSVSSTLITATQLANGKTYLKQLLILGDTSHTVLVVGTCEEAMKSEQLALRRSMLSTLYDALQNDNPLDAVHFEIEVAQTDFKFTNYFSGSLLYSIEGKIPTLKPTFVVGAGRAKVDSQLQKQFSEERLAKLPGAEGAVIQQITNLTIDQLNGYEIIAHLQSAASTPELIYLVMLFSDHDEYFIMVGQTKEQMETYVDVFRKIAQSFKRK